MFHVEPVPRWQAGQGCVSRIQGGNDQLRRDIADLLQQAPQVRFIQFGRGVIHK